MQEKAREEWKESYRAFCGLKEEVLPRGRPSSCLDTRQPAAAVPSTRTLSMADFEKRWSCLKDPNKSVQMSRDKAGFPTKKFFRCETEQCPKCFWVSVWVEASRAFREPSRAPRRGA